MLRHVAAQVRANPAEWDGYVVSRARLVHHEAVCRAFGYSAFGSGARHVAFLRWLRGRCWTAEDSPAQLVDLATGWLVEHQVFLPGFNVLQRLCARAPC